MKRLNLRVQQIVARLYRGFGSRQNTALAWIIVVALTGLLLIGVVAGQGLR